ncbi:MAG: DUF2007 domain-containing protein [Alphaproteobacteria bacterium]|nr:DUF2007 domain-containing protein [Alphaproteobacteria bacterium]
MRELRRSNNLVYLSFAETALRAQGLTPIVLDQAVSAVEGSIGAIPRRLMVADGEAEAALAILAALDRDHGHN